MPQKKQPWQCIPTTDPKPYEQLAKYFCPSIRLKPFDLWQNPRAYFRAAILKQPFRGPHIARIRFAFHYVWDIPSMKDLEREKPGWTVQTRERIHARFVKHVKDWGPGDVEMVTVTLQRRPTVADLDLLVPSEFEVDELTYRIEATPMGVLKQIKNWEWDKLGNKRTYNYKKHTKYELDGKRPVLTVDSYHHSFYAPDKVGDKVTKWPQVITPTPDYFNSDLWKQFMITKKKRGYESWEVTA